MSGTMSRPQLPTKPVALGEYDKIDVSRDMTVTTLSDSELPSEPEDDGDSGEDVFIRNEHDHMTVRPMSKELMREASKFSDPANCYTALHPFDADPEHAHEMALQKGELVTILDNSEEHQGWWYGACGDHTGWFPETHVVPSPERMLMDPCTFDGDKFQHIKHRRTTSNSKSVTTAKAKQAVSAAFETVRRRTTRRNKKDADFDTKFNDMVAKGSIRRTMSGGVLLQAPMFHEPSAKVEPAPPPRPAVETPQEPIYEELFDTPVNLEAMNAARTAAESKLDDDELPPMTKDDIAEQDIDDMYEDPRKLGLDNILDAAAAAAARKSGQLDDSTLTSPKNYTPGVEMLPAAHDMYADESATSSRSDSNPERQSHYTKFCDTSTNTSRPVDSTESTPSYSKFSDVGLLNIHAKAQQTHIHNVALDSHVYAEALNEPVEYSTPDEPYSEPQDVQPVYATPVESCAPYSEPQSSDTKYSEARAASAVYSELRDERDSNAAQQTINSTPSGLPNKQAETNMYEVVDFGDDDHIFSVANEINIDDNLDARPPKLPPPRISVGKETKGRFGLSFGRAARPATAAISPPVMTTAGKALEKYSPDVLVPVGNDISEKPRHLLDSANTEPPSIPERIDSVNDGDDGQNVPPQLPAKSYPIGNNTTGSDRIPVFIAAEDDEPAELTDDECDDCGERRTFITVNESYLGLQESKNLNDDSTSPSAESPIYAVPKKQKELKIDSADHQSDSSIQHLSITLPRNLTTRRKSLIMSPPPKRKPPKPPKPIQKQVGLRDSPTPRSEQNSSIASENGLKVALERVRKSERPMPKRPVPRRSAGSSDAPLSRRTSSVDSPKHLGAEETGEVFD